jgi:uncharacterized protein with NRDE domain
MCTIIVLHRLHPRYPLVVGANRDEFYARPATPPRVLSERPRVIGGTDEERGGTWMGVTADTGLFVGITNQRSATPPRPELRSRGHLALDALRSGSASGALDLLESLDARQYNDFNLIFGDPDRLFVAYGRSDRERVELVQLEPGLTVLANDRVGSPHFPKTGRAARLVQPYVTRPWDELGPALARTLADESLPPEEAVPTPSPDSRFSKETLRKLQAICIVTPQYGTRSATRLAMESDGTVAHYDFADGAPCRTDFVSYRELLTGQ